MENKNFSGKGSKSRITDYKLYCCNYDLIFRKEKTSNEETNKENTGKSIETSQENTKEGG